MDVHKDINRGISPPKCYLMKTYCHRRCSKDGMLRNHENYVENSLDMEKYLRNTPKVSFFKKRQSFFLVLLYPPIIFYITGKPKK